MSSNNITTNALDHIMHMSPPGKLLESTQEFEELGFNVSPGGEHSNGLTRNVLIFFADGTYLEIISFNKDPSLTKNPLSDKPPGWVNAAHLGASPDHDIAQEIAERAKSIGSDVVFKPAAAGGRTRSDGEILKWEITASKEDVGLIPFFCTDVTPRSLRVPANSSNTKHPSKALGIAQIRVISTPSEIQKWAGQLTAVIGTQPMVSLMASSISPGSVTTYTWELLTPSTQKSGGDFESLVPPQLILSSPQSEEEERHVAERGPSIFEVCIFVDPSSERKGSAMSPYGRIAWVPLQKDSGW